MSHRHATLLLIAFGASIAHGDEVLFAPTAPGVPPYTAEGEILDYTGEKLTLQALGGNPRTYPADRVLRVETQWNDKHQDARAAMAKHDYQSAIGLLTAAQREEQRQWVRRMIIAELVQTYASLGQWERAGELFIALAQSDPTTLAYGYAPVAWYASSAVRAETARAWMSRGGVPAAALLGASHLLTSTGDSEAAVQALRELTNNANPPIAVLAESQLWRRDLQRVTPEGVERWERRLREFPQALRAGPTFIIGEALARLGQHDRAALAYLRVPILYEDNRHLAARALVAAAQAVTKAGHPDETQRLLAEVTTDFADTPQRNEAQALLRMTNDE